MYQYQQQDDPIQDVLNNRDKPPKESQRTASIGGVYEVQDYSNSPTIESPQIVRKVIKLVIEIDLVINTKSWVF